MKSNRSNIILIVALIFGLGLIAYPSIAGYWNSVIASHAIEDYSAIVDEMDDKAYAKLFEQAESYNKSLSELEAPLSQYDTVEGYSEALSVDNSPLMGVIRVDKINVELPIYHGTSNSVLSDGVGHMEGTSLPLGGKGRHTVLSAHRGLPSSKLFTDLDKLEIGDIFTLTVLNRTLTYQVEQINITLPDETQYLQPVKGKDYCTLVTCTPYGVNTHRLLVRGKRIDNIVENTAVATNDAIIIEKTVVALVIGVPILILLLFLTSFIDKHNRKYT